MYSNKELDAAKELQKMQSDSQKAIEEFNKNKKEEYSNKHTKYDDYFTYIIRQRGKDYYQRNLVSDLKKDNDTYSAIVSGTNNYKVKFKIDNKGIRNMDCECPYFQSGEGNCKHLYASILKSLVAIALTNINNVFSAYAFSKTSSAFSYKIEADCSFFSE